MSKNLGILINWTVAIAVTLTACSNSNKPGTAAKGTDASTVDNSTDAGDQQDAGPQVCPLGTTVASCPATIPSFSNVVTHIVESRCSGCHSQYNDAGLWPLNDQQSLSDWQITILQVLRECTQPPPGSGVSLTLSERKAIEAWLVCGGPNN